MTAVEIYKLLPKTNCGKCGTPTCFAFAVKLAANQASPDLCPDMTGDARKMLDEASAGGRESSGTVFEQTLEFLRPKIRALNFEQAARQTGARLINPDTLDISFMEKTFRVTKEKIVDSAGNEPEPFISILIYNHLSMPDPPAPAREWITFGSVPASHAKDKAWAGHVEEFIAVHFSGNVDGLKKACLRLGGVPAEIEGSHDAAFEFRLFPHYPALLLFHDALPEENFPAQCSLLLDKTAPSYLDIESIVVLGEKFAERLTGEER
jgi:hypothetical protein